MSAESPLIDIHGLTKTYGGVRPLRIAELGVAANDRIALLGLDAPAAEAFVHLVTGAMLPDEGEVAIGGRSTREIATDVEWLSSLDQFGLVSGRAVLLEQLSVAANLALPLTLAIDPLPAGVRVQVEALGSSVGLSADRLDAPVSSLAPHERLRLHLGRAMAPRPRLLLLEHPTATLPDAASAESFAATLRAAADSASLGWIVLTADERFARASGSRVLRLAPATGALTPITPLRWWFGLR